MSDHPQVCFATLGQDKPWTLENYRKLGGYEAWEKILREKIKALEDIDQKIQEKKTKTEISSPE